MDEVLQGRVQVWDIRGILLHLGLGLGLVEDDTQDEFELSSIYPFSVVFLSRSFSILISLICLFPCPPHFSLSLSPSLPLSVSLPIIMLAKGKLIYCTRIALSSSSNFILRIDELNHDRFYFYSL